MNIAALQAWLDKLAPRERLLVGIAGVLAVFAVIFSITFQPLLTARSAATAEITARRSLLADIETVARRFGPQQGASRPAAGNPGDSLVVLVDRTTRERQLGAYLKRNQPEGTGGIRLRFENVPFDQLLEWLAESQARHGLATVSASFDPSGEPGRVNSNLVLNRTGG